MTDRRVGVAPKSKPNLRTNASLLPLEVNGDAGQAAEGSDRSLVAFGGCAARRELRLGLIPRGQGTRAGARAHDFADVVLLQ